MSEFSQLTIVVFDGPGKETTFPNQVPNLIPNRTATDQFGKVGV
jgi:hypothetical protein